jgi:hypothetical protein
LGDENGGRAVVGEEARGGEGTIFEAATEDIDGVGIGDGVVDDPGGGGAAEQGCAAEIDRKEQETESGAQGDPAAESSTAGERWTGNAGGRRTEDGGQRSEVRSQRTEHTAGMLKQE